MGQLIVGKEQVRKGLASRFTDPPDVQYGEDGHWVLGDKVFSEQTLTGTASSGERIEVRGCDHFEFRKGKAFPAEGPHADSCEHDRAASGGRPAIGRSPHLRQASHSSFSPHRGLAGGPLNPTTARQLRPVRRFRIAVDCARSTLIIIDAPGSKPTSSQGPGDSRVASSHFR